MKPENFGLEMNQVLSTWGKPSNQSDAAVSAIREIEVIDCDSLRDIFNVLASKMAAANFCEADLNMMDEVSGFVCGEEEAKLDAINVYRQCDEEGARQRFAMRGES
jgi:hypothetical protein